MANKAKTKAEIEATGSLMQQALDKLNGKHVVLRSNMSGVWMGRLVASEVTSGALFTAVLEEGYKIHAWSSTAATSGLSIHGPGKGSRVCEPVAEESVVGDNCEILACTPKAVRAVREIKKWAYDENGREIG